MCILNKKSELLRVSLAVKLRTLTVQVGLEGQTGNDRIRVSKYYETKMKTALRFTCLSISIDKKAADLHGVWVRDCIGPLLVPSYCHLE